MANLPPVPAAKEPPRASLESPAGEEDEIDAVETAFLKGSFREALTSANRYLIHKKANTSKNNATTETVRIRTPLLPRLMDPQDAAAESSTMVVVVHGGESNATDRAAAVALQSWYELSKLEKKNNKNSRSTSNTSRGYLHLKPFLDTYTFILESPSNDCDVAAVRSMSLELLVIWIQFCRSAALDQRVDAATALTIQLLREVRSSALDVHSPAGQAACRELVMLLFTDLLPRNYNSNSEYVAHVLEFLRSPSAKDPPTCAARSVNSKDNITLSRDVIQQCLCFCNTDDGNWPAWLQDAFRDCRIALQAMLREIYHQRIKMEDERKHRQRKSSANNGDESYAAAGVEKNTDTNERPEESSSTRLVLSHDQTLSFRNPKSWKVACVNLLRLIRERLAAAASSTRLSTLSPQQRQRLQMLLLSVCLMYGWRRHRHRIAAAGRGALETVFWRPAVEILEALGIRASH